jgi:hypothetical protein
MYTIRPIAKESIARALERAERYRLLNEPLEAESICLDVLLIEPGHQGALACLLLAVTDQFGSASGPMMERAKQLLSQFSGEFERKYYAGIINERYARQQIAQAHPGAKFSAHDYLTEAIQLYGEADALAPDGNDDAILRHNTCVRMIGWHQLVAPHQDEHELPLE